MPETDKRIGEGEEMSGTRDFATTGQPSDFTSNTMEASRPELGTSSGANSGIAPSSNLAAQPDSYSMFQQLMEAKVSGQHAQCT